ncbi:MAG: methylmalonyl Co-A mutase-associated GTPase MeaB [Acidobacteriota bacterium]
MVDPAAVAAGDIRALARALTLVERGGADAEALLAGLRGGAARHRTLGITGAPGVGKSTLAQALGLLLVGAGRKVGVVAIDPSSPFSGGALLGDRVRMPELVERGGFVRSMATRGALGGVTAATADALDVLGAAGFEDILVETVGVGQDEVDVSGLVDTVVVVTVAGLGDDVQAAKAGLFEVANVFAVNKADRGGAEGEVAALEAMLDLAPPGAWRPPVVPVSAADGSGVERLLDAVDGHGRFLASDGRRDLLRRQRALRRLERLVSSMLWQRVEARPGRLAAAVAAVAVGNADPYEQARGLVHAVLSEER